MKRETYTVAITRPDNVSVGELIEYMEAAIDGWAGGMDPEDPLFERNFQLKIKRETAPEKASTDSKDPV